MATIVAERLAEPVSPELVLVDPLLARRERARIAEQARLPIDERPVWLRPAVAPTVALRAPRHEVSTPTRAWLRAAGASVAAAALLGLGVGSALVITARRAPPPAEVEANGARAAQIVPPKDLRSPTSAALSGAQLVERKILSLLAVTPAAQLPSRLVDPTTGLLRNNTQVTCRRRGGPVFRCLVRPFVHATGEGLVVDYRARGSTGVFAWHGYRSR